MMLDLLRKYLFVGVTPHKRRRCVTKSPILMILDVYIGGGGQNKEIQDQPFLIIDFNKPVSKHRL